MLTPMAHNTRARTHIHNYTNHTAQPPSYHRHTTSIPPTRIPYSRTRPRLAPLQGPISLLTLLHTIPPLAAGKSSLGAGSSQVGGSSILKRKRAEKSAAKEPRKAAKQPRHGRQADLGSI